MSAWMIKVTIKPEILLKFRAWNAQSWTGMVWLLYFSYQTGWGEHEGNPTLLVFS